MGHSVQSVHSLACLHTGWLVHAAPSSSCTHTAAKWKQRYGLPLREILCQAGKWHCMACVDSTMVTSCRCAPLFDASMVAASTAAHACSVVATEEFAAAGAGAGAVSAVAPYANAMHRSRMPGYLRHHCAGTVCKPGAAPIANVEMTSSFPDRHVRQGPTKQPSHLKSQQCV